MRQNGTGQLFTKFHPPLIKGVNPPKDALHIDLVLVQSNQSPQGTWSQLIKHQKVAGTVARKGPVRRKTLKSCIIPPLLLHLLPGFFGCAPAHQRLALSQAIGQKNLMALAQGIMTLQRHKKINRNQTGPLMQQLEKRVLPIGAGRPPDHRSGITGYRASVTGYPLAVALHIGLLQIGGQMFQMLGIGYNRMTGSIEKVDVPDPHKPHQHRQVLIQRRASKVLVHAMGTRQQRLKVIHANGQRNGQTNS